MTRQNEPANHSGRPAPPIELPNGAGVPSRGPHSSSLEPKPLRSAHQAQIVQASSEKVVNGHVLSEKFCESQQEDVKTGEATARNLKTSKRGDTVERGESDLAVQSGPIEESPVVSPEIVRERIVKSTVEVHTPNSILSRFFTTEATSVCQLRVIETEEFEDTDAESKYEKFTDFLRSASGDLSRPEDDPLKYFRGRWIEHDQVLLQSTVTGREPIPYIRFTGLRNEDEVRVLHASLSRRRFRKEYFPPLRICYVLQRISPLAGSRDEVAAAEDDPLTKDFGTLCGTRLVIDLGGKRRIVTIGGILQEESKSSSCFAITTSHLRDIKRRPLGGDPFSELELSEEDYDQDVDCPLVIDAEGFRPALPELVKHKIYDGDDSTIGRDQERASLLATPEYTGVDWALVRLKNPLLMLPNIATDMSDDKWVAANNLSTGRYLGSVAQNPGTDYLRALTASGTTTLQFLKKPANLRHPSGAWLSAWKAHRSAGLRRGDSGAWVVDCNDEPGTVYGHIMAATGEHAYILPLADILADIFNSTNLSLRLARPFDQLANLAKLHYSRGELKLADCYAQAAVSRKVMSQSTSDRVDFRFLNYVYSHPATRIDRDMLAQVVMRMGRDNVLDLDQLWFDAKMGEQAREVEFVKVMTLLRAMFLG